MIEEVRRSDQSEANMLHRGTELTLRSLRVALIKSPDSPPGDKIIAPLGSTAFDLKPGTRLIVSVVIQSKGIAHSHVPEQRDMYERSRSASRGGTGEPAVAHPRSGCEQCVRSLDQDQEEKRRHDTRFV